MRSTAIPTSNCSWTPSSAWCSSGAPVGPASDYEAWWRRLLDAQIAFVQPTSWQGEKVARLCFVNPRTTIDHVRAVLGTMA